MPDSDGLQELKSKALEGDADAQFNLGQIYRKGEGVPQDYKEAVKWFKKATEHGYTGGGIQIVLATMYHEGKGVPKDNVTAYMWLNLAALQGNKLAVEMINIIGEEMTKEQIAEAQRLSREFKAKAPKT
jgi:TPR repeat protein